MTWITHVAGHFEGVLPDGKRKMSDWKEGRRVEGHDQPGIAGVAAQDGTFDDDEVRLGFGGYNYNHMSPPDALTSPDLIQCNDIPATFLPYQQQLVRPFGHHDTHRNMTSTDLGWPQHTVHRSRTHQERGSLSFSIAALSVSESTHKDVYHEETNSSNDSSACEDGTPNLNSPVPAIGSTPALGTTVPIARYLDQAKLDEPWSTHSRPTRGVRRSNICGKLDTPLTVQPRE